MSKLYLVPTPIGNLQDITLRAISVLKDADIILAEDTRKTGILLKHFKITNKLRSFHKFNEHQTINIYIEKIKEGNTIALVSDSGTPGISDPGYLLVRGCLDNEIDIECLPGATSIIPALVNSGLPISKFCFEGFLPHKKGRIKQIKQLSEESRTMVFFESPHRIQKTLMQFCEYFGEDRKASISREITKLHEEITRGTLKDLKNKYELTNIKGEIVVVVDGKKKKI